MSNVKVKNADGADVFLKATGAGTDGDPHIPEHKISPGENHLGSIGGNTGYVELIMSLTAGLYSIDDVLADTQELTGILRTISGTGIIQSVTVLDKDNNSEPLDVVFLRTSVSMGTERTPISISDSDADEILGIVEVFTSDYRNLGGSKLATKTNLGIGCKGDASNNLFVALVSRGAGTYTGSGITLKVTVLQD